MARVTADSQLWLAAHSLLLERGSALFSQLTGVQKHFDPEAIHDLRVASRRLREALALFAPVYPPHHLDPLKRTLKKLTTMMGAIRNSDEALLFFAGLTTDVPAAAAAVAGLTAAVAARREEERATLAGGLQRLDVPRLRRRFTAVCARLSLFGGGDDLLQPFAPFLLAGLDTRQRAIDALLDRAASEADTGAQHRLRIAVKHFRYRFELLAPFAAAGYDTLYRGIKGYQELLGQMHDLDTFALLATTEIPDQAAAALVTVPIARQRHELFTRFSARQRTLPLATLSERARRLV